MKLCTLYRYVQPMIFKKGMLFYSARMLLILFLQCMIISCFNDKINCIRNVAWVNGKNEKITIKNQGKSDVFFQLDINRKLLYSLQDAPQVIQNMANDFPDEPETRKAWRFVTGQTLHIEPGIEDPWIEHPLPLLNSAGFGLCDDLAKVLCTIWTAQGYKARVWGLEGHVVPEVFDAGKWQMYDPSFAVYYLNPNGKVAGVEELAAQPWLIYDPIHTLPPGNNRSFILEARRYSHDLALLYQSEENNREFEKCELNVVGRKFEIHLPAGATMSFPVMTPDTIRFSDAFRTHTLKSFVQYTLPKGWTGAIHLPFVLCHVRGKGLVVLEGDTFQIETDTLNKMLGKLKQHYRQIEITSSPDTIFLYCLFNHALLNNDHADSVLIFGKSLQQISIRVEPNINYQSEPLVNFSTEKKISESAWVYYAYLKNNNLRATLPVFNETTAYPDSARVSESIRLLIHSIHNISEQEKINKTTRLLRNWAALYPALKSLQLKKKISFHEDPVYFAYLLSLLEHSNIHAD
jgi:hypothetical protein